MQRLPIDEILPDALAALGAAPSLVIEAPPGAGKTTRVPPAILAGGLAGAGEVVVLEPRRLAARLAARRVAEELGERVGETVGYQVRFEEVAGPRTRLRFVTEGLLTRRLLAEPLLPGVGAVVLDELHERHLQGDLALALLRRLQRTTRPDLKLVAMSATLDAAPVARFLGAASLRSEGRRFEVAVEYLSPEEAARPDARLEELVSRAVRRLHREGLDGDVLVFLPGAAEIRRAREALSEWAAATAVDLLPLHGDLPPEEQDRAVRAGARRKVILSTNVAETSVTIEGVVAVVDSGLARVASHSPWSGLPTLEVRKVSRASAAQRAGRAGRTRPGRALRLYTRHDHDTRPEFEVPEILREDLAETLLAASALEAGGRIDWLEPPPPAALEVARALLLRLGALDRGGAITGLGRRMLRLPVHPRLARLALEAAARGAPDGGALLAALLGERELRDRRALDGGALPPTGPSDLLELAHAFEEAARARFEPERLRRMGLNPGAVQAVERSRRQLQRLVRTATTSTATPTAHLSPAHPERSSAAEAAERSRGTTSIPTSTATLLPGTTPAEHALLLATLAAYPDRVARRRAPGSDEVVLVGGGSARLDAASVVREAALLVAVDAEERRGDRRVPGARAAEARVRIASGVTEEMLLDLFPDALRYEEAVQWNAAAERVEATERLVYEDLVLEESRAPRADPEKVAALLASEALARGPRAFAPEGALDRVVARIAFAAAHAPDSGLVAPTDEELAAALRELCAGRRSFAELREADLPSALLARLDPRARAALERLAPERVTLPGGRTTRVHYETGKPPWIESRLQDFFGLAQGPALAGGKVPLVLHLLAPNQRAVQVTTDLAGFWERHYPALRRELGRRYPRHAWPEDPRSATPPPARR
ncbi:ATP-dependent helicase C-terminal domain-containing protein [Anaeromyxobacter sp. Fw109-5]|uniref:ATP-dependent helicase C-terminal domain-containing protein n=1 Tax=Anaeromyxobacter sp. (strain Fw109-5) TaxID=404589 RepID=UPI0003115C33|nr:ATP-dependent helicase C-terminal domain-containing protein [Anaeromyxobacter sp. Fw109-5]